jgi:voltage-gated sodium channel
MFNGLKTTIFTIILLFTLIFSYGSVGYYLFRQNDPFHFGTYFVSCLTFFQMTTFENWSTYYYVNVFGCDAFPADYNYTPPAGIDINEPIQTKFGDFYLPNCSHPKSRPLATSLVFISYEILAGLGVISMCLAAVAIGINERLNELRTISLYGESQHDHVNSLGAVLQLNKYNQQRKQQNLAKVNSILGMSDNVLKIKKMMLGIWEGQAESISIGRETSYHLPKSYADFIQQVNHAQMSTIYAGILSLFCLLDASLQIAEATMRSEDSVTRGLHIWFQIMFMVDAVLTAMTVMHKPSELSQNVWFRFDFSLTITTLLPAITPSNPSFQILKYLRVCRLFQVLKFMSRYFQDLKIILGAISGSFWSVLYVMCLMLLFFSYYAIAGVLLLRRVDPWYFGSIPRAMSTLLQIMTLDNWSPVMRNSIFGCYLFGYNTGYQEYDDSCKSNDPHAGLGWFAAIYFISFIILAAMILNSLFVGMIITSMELLKESLVDENDQWRKVSAVKSRYSISSPTLDLILELFETLDTSHQASLSFEDMKPIMEIVNMPSADQYAFFVLVDTDHSGRLDFAEFSEMIVLMGLSHTNQREKSDDNDDTVIRPIDPNRRLSSSSVMSYESLRELRSWQRSKTRSISPATTPISISLKSMKETFQMSFDKHQYDRVTPRSQSGLTNSQSRIHPIFIDSELLDLGEKSAAASVPISSKNRRGSALKMLQKSSFTFKSPRIGHEDLIDDDIEAQSVGTIGGYYSARDLLNQPMKSNYTSPNNAYASGHGYFPAISSLKLSSALEVLNQSLSNIKFSPTKDRNAQSPPPDKSSPYKSKTAVSGIYHPLPRRPGQASATAPIKDRRIGIELSQTISPRTFPKPDTARSAQGKELSPYYLSFKSEFAVYGESSEVPSLYQPNDQQDASLPTSVSAVSKKSFIWSSRDGIHDMENPPDGMIGPEATSADNIAK